MASCRRSASRATSLRLRPVRLARRASWRFRSGSKRIVRAELFMSDNVIQAAPPNKRLKLMGDDRFKGNGVLCPWRARADVHHPYAGERVARSLSAIRWAAPSKTWCLTRSCGGRRSRSASDHPMQTTPEAAMKHTWTLGAVSVALALTTAVVFAQREQGTGVIFARSRSAKFSPLVPGVSRYVAWGDTLTGPLGGVGVGCPTSACSRRAMIALGEAECCALAGTDCRPTPLRRRTGRPQLKRDQFGGAAAWSVRTRCPSRRFLHGGYTNV